jgi:hypothetical protein
MSHEGVDCSKYFVTVLFALGNLARSLESGLKSFHHILLGSILLPLIVFGSTGDIST